MILIFTRYRHKTSQGREARRHDGSVRHPARRPRVPRCGVDLGAASGRGAQRHQLRSGLGLRRLRPVDRVTGVTSRLAPPLARAASPPARARPRAARGARRHHHQARAHRPGASRLCSRPQAACARRHLLRAQLVLPQPGHRGAEGRAPPCRGAAQELLHTRRPTKYRSRTIY